MTPPTYIKRYRMEAALRGLDGAVPKLPPGFFWLAWRPDLLEAHAQVKARCFAGEADTVLFPTLASLDGCRALMRLIASRPSFCPAATWLVARHDAVVGTVQGLADSSKFGAIQNLGVVAAFRGLGLGEALLTRALAGFAAAGMRRAMLEVTAANGPAMKLYRRAGFRGVQTLYKPVPVTETDAGEPEASAPGICATNSGNSGR